MIRKSLTTILSLLVSAPLLWGADQYPVKVGPDHRHLVTQQEKPYLVQGDAAWSLISGLTNEEAEAYLKDRKQKGFNSIIVNLIEHHFNGPVNRYGERPFMTPEDFSTPNEKYFEHADWVIRKAAENGIQVFLAPIYLGYKGTDEGWIKEVLANGPEKDRNWGRYVGKRYAKFDNIVWLIGGDRNPGEAHNDVDAIVQGIKVFDKRHIFTAHCAPENSATDQYGQDGWVDLNTVYSYNLVHTMLRREYDQKPVMPFVLIESTYEGEHNASHVQIRRQAYWAVLSGATGQFLGNRPIWLFDPGWREALNATGSQDMARLYALFTSRPWYKLVPDENHEVVVAGLGEFFGLDYLMAARTKDGSTIMAYLPSARVITVDLRKVSSQEATAWWYNPRSGDTTMVGKFQTVGMREFTPPGEGDWVFVLDDSSLHLSAPGKPAIGDDR